MILNVSIYLNAESWNHMPPCPPPIPTRLIWLKNIFYPPKWSSRIILVNKKNTFCQILWQMQINFSVLILNFSITSGYKVSLQQSLDYFLIPSRTTFSKQKCFPCRSLATVIWTGYLWTFGLLASNLVKDFTKKWI